MDFVKTTGSMGVPPMPHDASDIIIRDGSYLPHWTKNEAVFAVTFRLADSIPQSSLRFWKDDQIDIIETARMMKRKLSADETVRLRELQSKKIDHLLDGGRGACWLKKDEIAELVANAFVHFDHERYELFAWCIMPNHVHIVLKPLPDFTLDDILHSWKSFTAKESNKLLKRTGIFWHAEYYDHLIRSRDELVHAIEYAWSNPDKAGLKHWKWRWKVDLSNHS